MLLSELSQHTDKDITHNYCTHFYNKAFEKYKNEKINLLEIGVLNGASLIMWHEYFKNAEKIVGVDRNGPPDPNLNSLFSQYLKTCSNTNAINIITGDAYNESLVYSLENDFDIIIDDGDHSLNNQIKFINFYSKKLKKGGMLIIEDVFYVDDLFDNIDKLKFNIEIIDLRKIHPYSNDSVIFVISMKELVAN